jgi:type I restriction enzyme, S subunit
MLLLEQFHNLTLNPANAARLKELVLQLAVQGKLTESWRKENPDVEPASELLKKIEAKKERLVKEKKIKKEPPLPDIEEDETTVVLSEQWVLCRLGKVIELISGQHIDTSNYNELGIGFPYLTGPSDFGMINPIFTKWTEFPKVLAHKNDILVTVKGSGIGKLNILHQDDVVISRQLMAIRSPYISKDYLLLFLKSQYKILQEQKVGIAIPGIGREDINSMQLPLPPLAEQGAIVARVEELFKNIEALQEKTATRIILKKKLGSAALQNLTTATPEDLPQNWHFLKQNFGTIFDEAANVKKLRETILQLAVQGKLTQAWRHQNPNPEPASELLKRIQGEKEQLVKEKKIKKEKQLDSVSEEELPYELPESWVWCKLSEIASKLGAGSTPKGGKEVYLESGIKFLRSQNIYDDGIRLRGMAYINEATHLKMSFTHVKPKDILLNITGGSIGRCALVPDNFDEANVSQHVAIVRLVDLSLRDYIHILLISPLIQKLIMDVQVGVSREGLSMNKLKDFLVPLPPFTEQEAITAKVEELMQLCDELEKQIEHSKQQTEELMQAVVQEALQVKEEVEL